MLKRPFLSFIFIISLLVTAVLLFIQSAQFAAVFKTVANRYIPKDMGIEGDFSDLSIKLFPPGFSIRNPKIVLGKRNIVNLPAGSSVKAERIDFDFRPFQILSGDIRVHEVTIVNGDIHLFLDPNPSQKKASSKLDFHWDELLQVKAEAVALQNVSLTIEFVGTQKKLEAHADAIRLAQWSGRGGLGYSVHLDLADVHGKYLKEFSLPENIGQIRGEVYVNALGLKLESLLISNYQTEFFVSGNLKGNLLDPKALVVDANVKVDGDIGHLYRMYQPRTDFKNAPHGLLDFTGKIKGNLDKPLETLKADGTVSIKNFRFDKWKADSVQAEFRWDASPSGGEISLVRASIASKEVQREGGSQPGEGGKVEIGAVKWQLGSTNPVKIPLRFEQAHLHWLGAGAIVDVYPMDFRINGKLDATFVPPTARQSWEVQADLSTFMDRFQLDNQRYLKNRPLKKVFDIRKLKLEGSVAINSSALKVNNVLLTLAHSKFKTYGKIDFKTGYDLFVNSSVNLEDVVQIAENDIHGAGTLNAHIRGPATHVFIDMDADLKDAKYLNLDLGNLKGRITWDDGPQFLIFSKIQLRRGETPYAVDGVLEFGQLDKVDMNVKVDQGNIQDFIQIFGFLTRDISWFPHELRGSLSGEMKVRGGLDLSALEILAHLNGRDWDYWGERFKSVHLSGGFDRGKYAIQEFQAIKRTGRVVGKISYDTDRNFDWDFQTREFTVSDLDLVALLDVPIRGKLKIRSHGSGPEGKIDSLTQADLSDFTVRGTYLAPSHFSMKTAGGVSTIHSAIMGGQGSVDVEYDSNPKQISTVRADFRQLDFSPILLLLNPKSIQDKTVAGYFSGATHLSFRAGLSEFANGLVSLSEYRLSKSDTQLQLVRPVSLKVQEGNFDLQGLEIKGKSGSLNLNLKNSGSHLEGNLKGIVDNAFAGFFTSTLAEASGSSDVDFAIGGKLKEPTFFGRVKVLGGNVRIASFDTSFENITGLLQLKQNTVFIQNVQADLGGGRISVDGKVDLFTSKYPQILVKGVLNNAKIKVYPFQYAKVRGLINVVGEQPPYDIRGNLFVDSALSREKVLNRKQAGAGLKALQYAPPPVSNKESGYSKFKLDIQVEAQNGVQISNDLFKDVQVKGKLTLINTLEAPRLLGTAEIIQGKILFKDHVFTIQSANANFDTPNVINPSFNLNANTEVNGTKIQMYATGRLEKMKIEFSAIPAMQESEILSLLAMGLTSSDAKKLSATDLNAVQQGEAASLVLHSLDFNRDLEDKTGFQVRLDESVNPMQGVSAFRPQTQVDSAAAPQITIRRKLGERVSLSAGSTVGVGTNKSNQVNLDFSVNRDLSVTGVYNSYGTTGSAADAQNIQQNSVGFDVKFQKRFK